MSQQKRRVIPAVDISELAVMGIEYADKNRSECSRCVRFSQVVIGKANNMLQALSRRELQSVFSIAKIIRGQGCPMRLRKRVINRAAQPPSTHIADN